MSASIMFLSSFQPVEKGITCFSSLLHCDVAKTYLSCR